MSESRAGVTWASYREKLDLIEKQKELIKQMAEVISFYGDKVNWTIDGHTYQEEIEDIERGEFADTIRNDCDASSPSNWHGTYGGKRARELQQSELFKELVK